MDALDHPNRVRRIREGVSAVRLQRLRLGGIAIPDVDLMTVVQHAANKAGPHQAGAEECDFHGFLLIVARSGVHPKTIKTLMRVHDHKGGAFRPRRTLVRWAKVADDSSFLKAATLSPQEQKRLWLTWHQQLR